MLNLNEKYKMTRTSVTIYLHKYDYDDIRLFRVFHIPKSLRIHWSPTHTPHPFHYFDQKSSIKCKNIGFLNM